VTSDGTIETNEAQLQVDSESPSGTMEKQGSAWGPETFSPPPTINEVVLALQGIKKILKPPRKTGPGYKDPELDLMFRGWLKDMRQFMWTYINPDLGTRGQWQAASLNTANNLEKGLGHARKLHQWVQAYVTDRKVLPINPYRRWNESVIDMDPNLAQEIHAHLQSKGKYVKAMDLVNFMDTPKMQEQTHLNKWIGLFKAQQWMKTLDYCWTYTPKGQYVDGHEREDVMAYRQNIFLP
jgi:hypothetical protein